MSKKLSIIVIAALIIALFIEYKFQIAACSDMFMAKYSDVIIALIGTFLMIMIIVGLVYLLIYFCERQRVQPAGDIQAYRGAMKTMMILLSILSLLLIISSFVVLGIYCKLGDCRDEVRKLKSGFLLLNHFSMLQLQVRFSVSERSILIGLQNISEDMAFLN